MTTSSQLDSQIRRAASLACDVTGMSQPLTTVRLSSWPSEDPADEEVEDQEDLRADSVLMADVIDDLPVESDSELTEAEPVEGEPRGVQQSLQPNDETNNNDIAVPHVLTKWEYPVVSSLS